MTGERVRNIKAGDVLLAQVFNFYAPGPIIFPTPESAEMQCGFGEVKKDKIIKPHLHNIIAREISNTSEFIYVIKGRICIIFLDPDGSIVDEAIIMPGYGFLQYVGGHKITILEGTQYFELKQGPYLGQLIDKSFIE